MSEEFVLFYGGICSQWYPSEFEIDGIKYNCAEQYMMAEKARLFEDDVYEKLIMESSHPAEQKAMGKKVRGWDQEKWEAVARDIVYKGNYAKFTQNPGLELQLRETEGKTLVEASPYDKIWGIGLGESDDDALDRSKWQGTNWLGEVCNKVREDIIAGVETTEGFNWS